MSQRRGGFTLIELIVVVGLIAMIAVLIYPPYRSSLRSFDLSTTKTSLQQNARIGMKRMMKEIGAGMIADMDDSYGWDWNSEGEGYDFYTKDNPYFFIFYLPDKEEPDKERGDVIALYAALPDDPDTTTDESLQPIDPANYTYPPTVNYDLPDTPLLYFRRYDEGSSSWEDPEPIIHSEETLKVTQLCFILGGENNGRVLITLELAQKGPTPGEWRTYKLVSTAKMGAR
ncbi:MAG: prepilin-type N-terminal cleavage/methylation domain-containing protein [Candidatus Aerophobetes bacterium]|nr:prepilin-type N-terminal cleavage/methylation domain-containing protein [Candidatus Aerophobetes bacterium]